MILYDLRRLRQFRQLFNLTRLLMTIFWHEKVLNSRLIAADAILAVHHPVFGWWRRFNFSAITKTKGWRVCHDWW